MRKFLLAVMSMIAATAIFVAVFATWFGSEFEKAGSFNSEKLFLIKNGQSVKTIAKNLQKQGLIDKDWVFVLATRIDGSDKKMRSGEYLIPPHRSMKEIIQIIVSGKQHQYSITIPEGLNIYQIMEIIKNNKNLTGDITVKIKEGYLFPETYNFTKGTTRNELILRMQNKMQEALTKEWNNRPADLPIKTKQEALILASIIEKETSIDSERARVAGVFINRLKKGMKLQTDPTVIYALTEGGKKPLNRKLYSKDLKIPHKFNTYYIEGLPPAPICSPGLASIKAALRPEKHNFLYFVADGTGGHKFATNLKEHNRNVANWRKVRNK